MTVEIGEELMFGEEGHEQLYEIVYTCEINEKQYLFAALSEELGNDKEPEFIAFAYTEDEEGTLFYDEIENEEEMKQIEEKFKSYIDELEKEE